MDKPYKTLRDLVAKYGHSSVQDMVDIAEQSFKVTSENLSAAIKEAKKIANQCGRDIALLFNRPNCPGTGQKPLFGYASVDCAEDSCILIVVTPAGDIIERGLLKELVDFDITSDRFRDIAE